ncbi:MAG: hypothetical protein ACI8X3_000754 [Saprospiraceae bacterium]|jgi:hypothetical protein
MIGIGFKWSRAFHQDRETKQKYWYSIFLKIIANHYEFAIYYLFSIAIL